MSSPPSVQKTMEVRRPRSSQRVSVSWDEPENSLTRRNARLQFEVAECVETKTITTTTTTKRSYPPLFVREPRPLHSLDTKEYPLASRPTPPEFAKFTVDLGEYGAEWSVDDDHALIKDTREKSVEFEYGAITKTESGLGSPVAELGSPVADSLSKSSGPLAEVQNRRSQRSTRVSSPTVTAAGNKSKKSARSYPTLPHAVSDRLRRAVSQGGRKDTDKASRQASNTYLATPDTTEVATGNTERPQRLRSLHLDRPVDLTGSVTSQATSLYEAASPVASDSQTIFSSNVATPPITDADVEPFADHDDPLQNAARAFHPTRPTINTVAAQDASLPSPRLSPTLAAAQLHTAEAQEDPAEDDEEPNFTRRSGRASRRKWLEESQSTDDLESSALVMVDGTPSRLDQEEDDQTSSILDTRSMLETFDAMPNEMKTFMMYQFLRRCPRKTLHMVADVVNPALKCDFLKQLPIELSLHVLSYLDHRDLCRAAQVSKHWRNIIDSNETGWKELLDRDGFQIAPGELDKAIAQGWGWQDPVGPEGCELDLSLQNRLTSTETELIRSTSKPEPLPKLRSSKRKRGLNSFTSAERAKRRASTHESVKEEKLNYDGKLHKSEGPISAASAAAVAVPDPQIGLPSLRKLHLFKSLYRRHYMIRQSWTSGKVKPGHVAFAAHPRHVITCLQFDEDKIITGSDDTLIHVYDTKTGKLRKKLEGHEGGVWALQYEGNTLVSGSTDRSVRVWDIEKGLCTQVFYGHTSTVRCLQILMPTDTGKVQDGKAVMMPPKPLIITGSRDSQLRVWRLPEAGSRRYIQTGPPANDAECPYFIRILSGHTHSVRAISAHGDTLVSGSYDSTVRVWRISTGEALHVLHGHSQKVYSVVLDHKRNRCISGSMDSLVKIWDLDTGACLHTLEGHSLLVGLLDLRDERLVSAAADSTLRIWDPETGKCKSTLMAHTGAITCFQHDGRKVISGSEKTVKMWDIQTGDCIQDLLTDLGGVWQVKFDERRCVAAVQRDNLTYVEILDFGAVRDGKPPEELGKRILLNAPEVQRLIEEEI
ncbi:Cell division control protein 4 [Pleurostoma richardsiae]|uniref:Cell division control protein 4 n=1 Tax=Pleurostoma richardsiae TaxID=41990 RepID=A0AA38VPT8_9PEZI|nr:Cell division control protein 4 [Pleurostoma richardsiae]